MYIGIGIGTSALKVLLMDELGRIIKTVSCNLSLSYPQPGWSEQRPEDWLEATDRCMQDLLADQDPKAVKGISFGGQMHGLVILDDADNVIRPAILWNDGRTQAETDYLNTTIGTSLLVEETGNIAFAGFTAPKLLWLQKHEPESFAKISKIMLPKDYLTYNLTGVHATDLSDASGTLLFDVRNQCWSQKMIEICNIREDQLPHVYQGSDFVGTVLTTYARKWELKDSVKVMAGAGDNAAAAVGTGTVESGKGNISLGTSGTIFVATDAYLPLSNNSVHQFCHTDGSYHLMGCMLSAASCHSWWQQDILNRSADRVITVSSGPGADELYFLPYLMGERSPHNDERIRGAFIGLSVETSEADMSYAVLEGVSFGLRDSLEIIRDLGIHFDGMTVTGGGARSQVWKSILSNILGVNLHSILQEAGPAYGAAILAAVGCGVWSSVYEASTELAKLGDDTKPEPQLLSYYEKKYRRFTKLYPLLKQFYYD